MTDFKTYANYKPSNTKEILEALDYINSAFANDDSYIYVLDTNALLKTYSLDESSLENLSSLFKTKRFFATHQIEEEFMRNRKTVGLSNYIGLKKNFTKKSTELIDEFQNLCNDYKYVIKGSESLQSIFDTILEDFKSLTKSIVDYQNSISDDIVKQSMLKYFHVISDNIDFSIELPEEYLKIVIEEFDKLFKELQEFKSDKNNNNKAFYIKFPGSGEKKPSNQNGDYVIFHEIMELAKKQDKDIILLTNDITKEDWVDYKKETFEEYQLAFYRYTKHAFKVKWYDEFLNEKIGVEISNGIIIEDDNIDHLGDRWAYDLKIGLERAISILCDYDNSIKRENIDEIINISHKTNLIDTPTRNFLAEIDYIVKDFFERGNYVEIPLDMVLTLDRIINELEAKFRK